jgi:hypothetical protein
MAMVGKVISMSECGIAARAQCIGRRDGAHLRGQRLVHASHVFSHDVQQK